MATTALSASSAQKRVHLGWLFSPSADASMVVLPAAVTLIAMLLAARSGAGAGSERAYAAWLSQFVLGNSTHVILTFLLLGVRRDVLHATAGQARTVIAGSVLVFAGALAFFWTFERAFPIWADFAFSIALVFATHHALSQAKGIWSLYNLRGKSLGIGPPGHVEAKLQRAFVPLGLSLVMIKFLFVPKSAAALFPFLQAIPAEEAVLPYEVTWLLFGVWTVFALAVVATLLRRPELNPVKIGYVSAHLFGVGWMLLSPAWGGIFTSGMHGLEYYLLCGRMLQPTAAEKGARLQPRAVWPVMLLAMGPLALIGVVNAPFTYLFGLAALAPVFSIGRIVLNAVVMAHYFADAFIYRFRIPEVRRVALHRLGMT
jgi:hypothetical protein